MKRFLIAVLLVSSILLFPMLSSSFSALAGRTSHDYGAAWCDCEPSCTTCYDENTWQQCNLMPNGSPMPDCPGGGNLVIEGSQNYGKPSAPLGSSSDGLIDSAGSLLMMSLVAYLLFRFRL